MLRGPLTAGVSVGARCRCWVVDRERHYSVNDSNYTKQHGVHWKAKRSQRVLETICYPPVSEPYHLLPTLWSSQMWALCMFLAARLCSGVMYFSLPLSSNYAHTDIIGGAPFLDGHVCCYCADGMKGKWLHD